VENDVESDWPQRAFRGGKFKWLAYKKLIIFITSQTQTSLRELTTTLRYTYGATSFPCYISLLLIFISLSIALHILYVFCVPCTVCDNMQQCADTATLSGNCSAVWDALSLQFTCTEDSVSIHVHWRVTHTRVLWTYRAHVIHTCIHSVCPYSETHRGSELQRITGTDVSEHHKKSPPLKWRQIFFYFEVLSA